MSIWQLNGELAKTILAHAVHGIRVSCVMVSVRTVPASCALKRTYTNGIKLNSSNLIGVRILKTLMTQKSYPWPCRKEFGP